MERVPTLSWKRALGGGVGPTGSVGENAFERVMQGWQKNLEQGVGGRREKENRGETASQGKGGWEGVWKEPQLWPEKCPNEGVSIKPRLRPLPFLDP